MEDASIGPAVKALKYVNKDDESMTYQSHRLLELERRHAMAIAFPEIGVMEDSVVAVIAKDDKGESREFIAIMKDGIASLVVGSCQILFEDMSPSECVEYNFAEEPAAWASALISCEALETYRGMKFEAWKKMLLEPTCEAQFRRMLQIGPVIRLYDPQIFPTPDSLKSSYQVTDEKNGRQIQLPHPVASLRIWNAAKQCYDAIDPQLKGAPSEAEKSAWWTNTIKELKGKHGDEYVSSFLR